MAIEHRYSSIIIPKRPSSSIFFFSNMPKSIHLDYSHPSSSPELHPQNLDVMTSHLIGAPEASMRPLENRFVHYDAKDAITSPCSAFDAEYLVFLTLDHNQHLQTHSQNTLRLPSTTYLITTRSNPIHAPKTRVYLDLTQ
uniref:Uncharacterized protein n=1 Tax=Bionectria ochroleuca TaxID=29856 RepID=A0A8H7NMY0_BIOOC